MNIANRPPLGLKQPKAKPDPEYLRKVRALPCAACGRPGPNEAHHCRDRPDHDEQGLYVQLPGAAQKSADADAIPLCPHDHRLFHLHRSEFHSLYGKDYSYIAPTRADVSDMEVGF